MFVIKWKRNEMKDKILSVEKTENKNPNLDNWDN